MKINLNKMGEIADMMLDGILDEQTGEYLGEAVGFPRTAEKGFYNSMNREKKKRNLKNSTGQVMVQQGGSHLVGNTVFVEKYGDCIIQDYINKRGKKRKRYVVVDKDGQLHKVKFNQFNIYCSRLHKK
jgi:hypothetical protein